ncbi:MAG: GSCFA family protein [Candidatus Nephrothrix sp. EaCA]|nr:MAG: GSCFA family protein [Candidatus Nephrothrix sp. EaCA]
MASFRTEIKLEPSRSAINHADSIVTIGSCFSDSIGNKLLQNKFLTAVNPLGTIYHPIGIAKSVGNALKGEINPNHFTHHRERWFHFDFHSRFSGADKEELRRKLEAAQADLKDAVLQAKWILITAGTAWGYKRISSGETAVNCCQAPGKEFEKRLYSIGEMTSSFQKMRDEIGRVNPSLQWILTVSPVRHLNDGLEGNAVSKSALRLFCHQLTFENVFYFPAYEIMTDDLRDYRFYSRDMIHPSEEAADYIWEKFSEQFFAKETADIMRRWQRVRKSLLHRPFNPSGASHEKFLNQMREELLLLQSSVDVKEELKRIEENLTRIK